MHGTDAIPRRDHAVSISDPRRFPVVDLIGARQIGKTTLARSVIEGTAGT